jgi:hypothetical protein
MRGVVKVELECRVCRRALTNEAVVYGGKAHCYRCGLKFERDEALARAMSRRRKYPVVYGSWSTYFAALDDQLARGGRWGTPAGLRATPAAADRRAG